MSTQQAQAVWQGSLKQGHGRMRMPRQGYEGPYTFASRFEGAEGTNPEELIAAAHAGCYSQFLALLLDEDGTPPDEIETTAEVTIGEVDGAPTITDVVLHTVARVPDLAEARFAELADEAKAGCPVSKALAGVEGVEISLEASLAV